MAEARPLRLTRRSMMIGAGLAIGGLAGIRIGRATAPVEQQIVAAPRSFALRGDAEAVTAGWGYGDAFPPPTLRRWRQRFAITSRRWR